MQILPEQVAQETLVSKDSDLIKLLKRTFSNNYRITEPKVILVFDSNEGAPDAAEWPWKVHVFYSSPNPLREVDLDVPEVLAGFRIKPQDEEVIRTIYPGGYVGYCGKIGGDLVWIT